MSTKQVVHRIGNSENWRQDAKPTLLKRSSPVPKIPSWVIGQETWSSNNILKTKAQSWEIKKFSTTEDLNKNTWHLGLWQKALNHIWKKVLVIHYFRGNSVILYMIIIIIIKSNGNRTEWSPIRSVIIWVINKIDLFNHNFNKICDVIGYFLNQNTRNSKFCFASSEKKKPFKHTRDGAYCPIT